MAPASVLGWTPVLVIWATCKLPMREPLTEAAEPMPGSMLPSPISTPV